MVVPTSPAMLLSTKRTLDGTTSPNGMSSSSAKTRHKPFTEEYIDNLRKIYLEASDVDEPMVESHQTRLNKQLDFGCDKQQKVGDAIDSPKNNANVRTEDVVDNIISKVNDCLTMDNN